MAKRVIFAVAGAGKTYHICHGLNPDNKNLILAYTNENIFNIKRELVDSFGRIPDLTNVMTYDSFVYRYIICPFEPAILRHFHAEDFFKSQGVTTQEPPQPTKVVNKKRVPNPYYAKKDQLEHYHNRNCQYYCGTLSELVLQIKQGRQSLINLVAETLNKFYDAVYIDEFQDFREYDYDLIIGLANQLKNVLLVGDFYQHSVSGANNAGKPFKVNGKQVLYEEFKRMLQHVGFEVDETTLIHSRRCSSAVCAFVKEKLQINIESNTDSVGEVVWVDSNVGDIIENDRIVKLVYKNAKKYNMNVLNWSYSKGDTFEDVCVILTDKLDDLSEETFNADDMAPATRNALYVALTRPRGNLYVMKAADFKNYQENSKQS